MIVGTLIVRILFAVLIIAFGIGSCLLVWERDAKRRRQP